MKKLIRVYTLFLCITMLLCVAGCGKKDNLGADIVGEQKVSVLFSHDVHSHLDNMAQVKTIVDERKARNDTYVLVDGGDIAMGTLYQTIFQNYAPDMMIMGKVGYDATTFGNHEFDYLPSGLANMLHSAKKLAGEQQVELPQLVVSNIDWAKNTTSDNVMIQDALNDFGSSEYTIIERNGVRIGIFGVLGEEAAEDAPMSGLVFEDIIDTSKRMVAQLQAQNVDLIICLSHSGTNKNAKKSEDELLAQAVPEIDVIISAHSHTRINTPIVYGNTTIVSHGCYLENLGELVLMKNSNGRWSYVDYQMMDLSKVSENQEIKSALAEYKEIIGKEYLEQFGLTYDQVLAENNIDFYSVDEMYAKHGENGLGNIISDAFMYAVKEAEGENYTPITMTIEPVGVVRDTFHKGKITTSDVFNVSSLGIGPDGITGYPLTQVYLTGAEIKSVAEIDASVSALMTAAQLHASGVTFNYNSKRMILNRVTGVKIYDTSNGVVASYENGSEIKDDELYRVVAGLYSIQMLGAVKKTSYGLINLVPKDQNGNPVTDYNDCIIHDANGNEIKEWVAIADYIASFEQVNGIPQFPERYATVEGRKVDAKSLNPVELFKSPNKIGLILYGVIIVVIIVVVVLLLLLVKLIRRIIKTIKDKAAGKKA